MRYFGSDYTAYKKERKAAGGMNLVPSRMIDAVVHKQLIDTLIEAEEDVYFMVNPGGILVKDIKRPVACFLDLDAGRDSKKQYKPLDEVAKAKGRMIKTIAQFSELSPVFPEPTAIVETRNGFQLYWKIRDAKISMRKWNKVQHQIAYFFRHVGADNKVLKANQILRLPYTKWFKTYEPGDHDSFDVTLYDFSGKDYSFGELASAVKTFPRIEEDQYAAKRCSASANSGSHSIQSGYATSDGHSTQGIRKTTVGQNLTERLRSLLGRLSPV